jgi:hypothetical protein
MSEPVLLALISFMGLCVTTLAPLIFARNREETPPPDFLRPKWQRILASWKLWLVMFIGAMALVLLAGRTSYPTDIPTVSLTGLKYTVDGWNTHSVDLRIASSSGIGVEAQHMLRFTDLWVSIPATALDYEVYAEFYGSNDYNKPIGASDTVPVKQGAIQLGDVQVDSDFQYENAVGTWRVQKEWENITIILITKHGNDVVARNRYYVNLDPYGQSWFYTPPNVNFASIVYAVNDGPDQILDFRSDTIHPDYTRSIEAAHPFTLTLREVWYNSNATRENSNITFYAFLTAGGYNGDTMHGTDPIPIQSDTHQIQLNKPISWAIPADSDFTNNRYKLIMYWIRNDGAVMNTINVPIMFSEKPLQKFNFKDNDPSKHGWQILNTSAPITFTKQTDGRLGDYLLMMSGSDPNANGARNGMEIPVNPNAANGTWLDVLARYNDDHAVYARVQMKSQQGDSLKTGWLKFKVGQSQIQQVDDDEWLIQVDPAAQTDGWRLMSINLHDAVEQTFGQQGWRYQALNSIRLRGDLELASILVSQ